MVGGERVAWGSQTAIAASLAMEAAPEEACNPSTSPPPGGYTRLLATPVPKPPAARQRPTATAPKKRKANSTTDTAEEKPAAKSAKTVAALGLVV